MPRPPFEITPAVLRLCADIERTIGRIEGIGRPTPSPQLRRRNRIRTIQGSLAIEGNTLSVEQITAILEGKRVAGPKRDVVEVQNAIVAYERLGDWQAGSMRSFLAAHTAFMSGLVPDAGKWRSGGVGIFRGNKVAHVAPQARRVPVLMRELFAFVRKQRATPWVTAAVFHYELEFIHPFSDGNGRMGRLWQQVIMAEHDPVFAAISIESLVEKRQRDYYRALRASDAAGSSTAFVEFSLRVVADAIRELADELRPSKLSGDDRVIAALAHFGQRWFTRADYLRLHSISSATASRDLRRGIEQGQLTRTGDRRTARYRAARP